MQTILTIQCALKPLLNKVAPQNHNHKGLQGEYLKPINSFCGLPVVLPDVPIKHTFLVHEPSLNSRDLEFEGKGSLFNP